MSDNSNHPDNNNLVDEDMEEENDFEESKSGIHPKVFKGDSETDSTRILLENPNNNGEESGTVNELEIDEAPEVTTNILTKLKNAILGEKLKDEQESEQLIGKTRALAILSSDALSSVAYGTEASLGVLVLAGAGAMSHNFFIGLSVVILLAIVALSYRQTIKHYPNGGGSYIVAKDNIGDSAGLVAAGALLIDYVLTVAVSVSAGVDALLSIHDIPIPAYFFFHIPMNTVLDVTFVLLIMLINLRGMKDSSVVFAAPTYIFIFSFSLMIIVGIVNALLHGGLLANATPQTSQILAYPQESFTPFLVLVAFASGCSAMTGVEAISNGIPIFKEPKEINASKTLTMMAAILGFMYLGTTYLAWRYGITPNPASNPTVTAQITHLFFFGNVAKFQFGSIFFWVVQLSTTFILILAANTSFADFPRLSSILAKDNYMPHFFRSRGNRLAFTAGIIFLGTFAAFLLIIFNGRTDSLINLYAVGVFTAFTFSQAGMVKRWLTKGKSEPNWRRGFLINVFGAITTGVVAIVILVAKFDLGAWVVLVLIVVSYFGFAGIHRHYETVQTQIDKYNPDLKVRPELICIVPFDSFNNLVVETLRIVANITPNIIGVSVITNDPPVTVPKDKDLEDAIALEKDPAQAQIQKKEADWSTNIEILRSRIYEWKTQNINESENQSVQSTDIRLLQVKNRGNQNFTPYQSLKLNVLKSSSGISKGKDVLERSDTPAPKELSESSNIYQINGEPKLFIIRSPYRWITRPILKFIADVELYYRNKTPNSNYEIIVAMPEYANEHWWQIILHNQISYQLKFGLLRMPGNIRLLNIPYHLDNKKSKSFMDRLKELFRTKPISEE